MAADNGFVNLEQLRLLANSDLLKDQLLVYCDLKTQREVLFATEINHLTRQELKGLQKDDMIRVMEMRLAALQLHH
ncbi:hypothetical protein Tco_0749842 [Tanacetum coccineum]|uniref:Uncharacterized protein n=1 Tax=Tanacetum coccineum TaxID=301880 RepID=A0ABQ4Z0M2_9ASTR